MSSEQVTLRDRFREDLRSGSLPVILTAVPLAMAVGLGSGWYWDQFAAGFLLLLTIGVLVPYAHETYCSQNQSWKRDVLWTVGASAVACGLFASSYLLAGTLVTDPTHNAAAAFVATFLSGAVLLRFLR
ncbi:hypothetical protein [Natronorubrum tibetense]|uniref:Uncharacterized protein n=1 Tax=Natronorubrum tibetense GA33 TaxID=1114856 RepID=L9VK42_9EURY|nr:hypothetical protein [Natronorubrum tibetense]ELY37446.1 hypothetical protein C496_20200 [Natronorubrum tibetense GA33]